MIRSKGQPLVSIEFLGSYLALMLLVLLPQMQVPLYISIEQILVNEKFPYNNSGDEHQYYYGDDRERLNVHSIERQPAKSTA